MMPRLAGVICGAAALCIMTAAAGAETGIASIYAYGGSRTASGERANPATLTAAHRTLPFGSHVRITNKRNGKSVVVRINDRGPFLRGRVIDVTPAAARVLGFSGLTRVSLERVAKVPASENAAKPPERKPGETVARAATPTPLPPTRPIMLASGVDAAPVVAAGMNAPSDRDVESTGSIIKAADFETPSAVAIDAGTDAENSPSPADLGMKAALLRFWGWITGP